jgi:hypothetical protein
MVIRYKFHIENFTRYAVTGAVDSNVLGSLLYIMKAYLVMYSGFRQGCGGEGVGEGVGWV